MSRKKKSDGPVDDDPELSRHEGQLVQVVRPRHEPAEKAVQPQAEDERD
jgi:hypothetical protein